MLLGLLLGANNNGRGRLILLYVKTGGYKNPVVQSL